MWRNQEVKIFFLLISPIELLQKKIAACVCRVRGDIAKGHVDSVFFCSPWTSKKCPWTFWKKCTWTFWVCPWTFLKNLPVNLKKCPWTWIKCPWILKVPVNNLLKSAREPRKCPWTIFRKIYLLTDFLIWVYHYDGDKPANKPNKLSPLFDCTLAGI